MGRRQRFAASHQRSWLWGRNAVIETCRAQLWPIEELFWSVDLPAELQNELERAGAAWHCTWERVPRNRLTQLCGNEQHQGVLARMGPFPYLTETQLWSAVQDRAAASSQEDSATNRSRAVPLWLIADRIQDSFNFGAMLRVADGVAVDGVIVGSVSQAAVTPQVARSSAGAINHVPIYQVHDLSAAAQRLKTLGLRIAGASEKADTPVWQQSLLQPLAVIIGNEGQGIEPGLQSLCDVFLRIPMEGRGESLNAAVSAGILLYEIRRQQWTKTADTRGGR